MVGQVNRASEALSPHPKSSSVSMLCTTFTYRSSTGLAPAHTKTRFLPSQVISPAHCILKQCVCQPLLIRSVLNNLAETIHAATQKPLNDSSDIQELLDTVDLNGDGFFSRDEVEMLLMDLVDLKKSAKRMKKALIAMGVLVALLIAMMMTTSYLGNELAKDMRPVPGSSALKDLEGNTIQMQPEQISLDIYQLPTQPVHVLENIEVRDPTTWTIHQQDGPNHLGTMCYPTIKWP